MKEIHLKYIHQLWSRRQKGEVVITLWRGSMPIYAVSQKFEKELTNKQGLLYF
jgi:hypothetical protein